MTAERSGAGPLFGRADELARVRAALDAAAAGRGFAVLGGRAHWMESELAYLPVVEAFGTYLRETDAPRRHRLVRDLPDLGRLFAELDLPGPPAGDPPLERAR